MDLPGQHLPAPLRQPNLAVLSVIKGTTRLVSGFLRLLNVSVVDSLFLLRENTVYPFTPPWTRVPLSIRGFCE